MRITLLIALLLAGSAVADDKVAPVGNDLAMKIDAIIGDGDVMVVGPDGHVSTLSPSADRRKAMESAFAAHGVEVKAAEIFMLRSGKLFRMDAADAPQGQGLSVK